MGLAGSPRPQRRGRLGSLMRDHAEWRVGPTPEADDPALSYDNSHSLGDSVSFLRDSYKPAELLAYTRYYSPHITKTISNSFPH